ncbi:MAG: hypothetical protein IPJ79_01265 [Bacteroidetes bacterium]|nr:hypothetical protein [Bacteroidota bacterium]
MKYYYSIFFLFVILNYSQAQPALTLKAPVGHHGSIEALAWSNNERLLASGGNDFKVIVWDIKSGEVLFSFDCKETIQQIEFSPDASKLYVLAGSDPIGMLKEGSHKIFKFDLRSGRQIDSFDVSKFPKMNLSPDGKIILVRDLFSSEFKGIDAISGNNIGGFSAGASLKKTLFTADSKHIVRIQQNPLPNSAISKYQVDFFSVNSLEKGKKLVKPEKTFQLTNNEIKDYQFSKDGKFFVFVDDKELKILDATSGLTISTVNMRGILVNLVSFNSNSTKVFCYSPDEKKIISFSTSDLNAGYSVVELKDKEYTRSTYKLFSPNSKYLAVASNKLVKVIHTVSGNIINELRGYAQEMNATFFTKDNNSVITATNPDLTVSDLKQRVESVNSAFSLGSVKVTLKPKENAGTNTSNLVNNFRLFNFKTGEVLTEVLDTSEFANKNVLSTEKYSLFNGQKEFASAKLGKRMGLLNSMGGSDNSKNIFKRGSEVTYLISNISKDTFSIYHIDSIDWVIVNKNGYFSSSKNGASKLHYLKGAKVYSFDQFDIQFNRPDKILKEIGLSSDKVIRSKENQVKQRWVLNGVDTSFFDKEINLNVPQVAVINEASIENPTKSDQLNLTVKATDESVLISSLHVWINGVPLYGEKGLIVLSENKNSVNRNVSLQLTPGNNIIEVEAWNIKSVKSLKERIDIEYLPGKSSKPNLYLVSLGVSNYLDPKWNDLKFAAKDAEDLTIMFKRVAIDPKGPFQNVVIKKLLNEQVTTEAVLSLKSELQKSKPEDCVIIFYSGHGLRDEEKKHFILELLT